MRHLAILTALLMPVCWLLPPPVARAQVIETVQQLLPATVAVELKATRAAPAVDQGVKELAKVQYAGQSNSEYLVQQLLKTQYAKQQPVDSVSYASGTAVSDDGLVVTMIGEVGDGKLTVTLRDGKQVSARLLVHDQRSGLQLIQIEADDLSPVRLFAGDLRLGQRVATAMCTDVRDRVVATGIVTAVNRSVDGIATPLIQTDVRIGLMSAGAPVANMDGEVIGIWLGREENDASGVSFAVPSQHIRQLIEARGEQEHIVLQRGYLGIQLNEENSPLEHPQVIRVGEDTAAMEAGLKNGDVIISINGQEMKTPSDVVRFVQQHRSGDEIELAIERDGSSQSINVALRPLPTPAKDDNHRRAIEAWQAARVVGLNADGALQYWDLGTGKAVPIDVEKPKLNLNSEQTKQLLENYRKAFDAQTRVGSILGQTTVRVQRSDVEQKLGELSDRVVSLQSEVEKLTRELKTLGDKLKDE